MISMCEYIWLDGSNPTKQLRSKGKTVFFKKNEKPSLSTFPEWNFDGSSTNQSVGSSSDLILKPARFVPDPLRGDGNYLVICEVYNEDGTPHETNTRAKLREALETGGDKQDPWIGFEQEYTLFKDNRPLGWPIGGYPPPQGPFYCGVGANRVYGRETVEQHARLCIEAGLMLYGINAEVMPAQWEFQIGYRGLDTESADPLTVADHLWIARWLLMRVGEEVGIAPNFDCKPIKGDWNGAGKHTNFSTRQMRDPEHGLDAIKSAIKALENRHHDHIAIYGDGLEERLTGLHETCHIDEFKSGTANRLASVRIPFSVAENGYGYLEDRRPGANADPYEVAAALVETICLKKERGALQPKSTLDFVAPKFPSHFFDEEEAKKRKKVTAARQ